jgi:tetratricopeptide (TPR) repeat protein
MKTVTNSETAQLIEVAEHVLAERSEKPLADHEKAILAHVLAGEPLKTAKAGRYRPGTIVKQLAPRLWHRLGEEVRCKNVQLFLENAAERYQSANSSSDNQGNPLSLAAEISTPAGTAENLPERILHNLPQRPYSKFIGRQQDMKKVLKWLMPRYSIYKICITGIGGVGKTSLALACAYHCLYASSAPEPPANVPIFDLIIFVSAKERVLDRDGLHQKLRYASADLVQQILNMLGSKELLTHETPATSFEEQVDLICRVLEKYRTLLILDNLETVQNLKKIESFLQDLPGTVRSILTTRNSFIGDPIPLTVLSEEEGLNLVQHQAKHIGVKLSAENCKDLYDLTGGLPLAIHLVIGQLYRGRSIERVQKQLLEPTGDLVQYCFKASVESIQDQPAYYLLLAATLLPESVPRDLLINVVLSDCDDPYVGENAIEQLQTLSLVSQEDDTEFHSRYRIVAPLRTYLHAQLQNHPQFEQEARERWLREYLQWSKMYTDQYPGEWQGRFEGLDREWENILMAANWAMQTGRYDEMLQLWQHLKPYFYMVGRGANGMRFWLTGLEWAAWLTEAALERQDNLNAGAVLYFRAWVKMEIGNNQPDVPSQTDHDEVYNNSDTLLKTNEPAIEDLLKQAWELQEFQSEKDQANISREMGCLQIRQGQFEQAHDWLKRSEQILQDAWSNASLDERKYQESLSHTRYYQGWACLKSEEFDHAESYFKEAYQYAEQAKYDRLVQMIKIAQAEVAMRQKDFKLAKTLFDECLKVAKLKADLGQQAIIKHSLAKLAHAEGNMPKKRREADEAMRIFKELGMSTEARKVQILLDSRSSDRLSQ